MASSLFSRGGRLLSRGGRVSTQGFIPDITDLRSVKRPVMVVVGSGAVLGTGRLGLEPVGRDVD